MVSREIPPVSVSIYSLVSGSRRETPTASHRGCDACLPAPLPTPQPMCLLHLQRIEMTLSPLLSHAPYSHQKSWRSMMLCGGLQLALPCIVCGVLHWKCSLVLIKALRTQVRQKEEKMLRTANFLNCSLAPFETYLM